MNTITLWLLINYSFHSTVFPKAEVMERFATKNDCESAAAQIRYGARSDPAQLKCVQATVWNGTKP